METAPMREIRISDRVQTPVRNNEIEAVEEISPSLNGRKTASNEDEDISYRVTISLQARQKYREMLLSQDR